MSFKCIIIITREEDFRSATYVFYSSDKDSVGPRVSLAQTWLSGHSLAFQIHKTGRTGVWQNWQEHEKDLQVQIQGLVWKEQLWLVRTFREKSLPHSCVTFHYIRTIAGKELWGLTDASYRYKSRLQERLLLLWFVGLICHLFKRFWSDLRLLIMDN